MRPARGRRPVTPDWEVPYIPPGGLVDECLLPDGCDSCDDPVMFLPLRPLRDFDHPLLRRVPGADPDGDPLWNLDSFMAKQCAGMNHRLRAHPEDLMRAFRTGEFSTLDKASLSWTFAGMRSKYVFPGLVAGAKLPIFEVARCFWRAFNGIASPWPASWTDGSGTRT